MPFLDFSEPIRKIVYRANSVKSLNASLLKVATLRRHLPADEAALECCTWRRKTREPAGLDYAMVGMRSLCAGPSTLKTGFPSIEAMALERALTGSGIEMVKFTRKGRTSTAIWRALG